MSQIELALLKTNAENERVKRVAEESKNTAKRQQLKDLKEQLQAAQAENARLMVIVQCDSSAASSEEEEKEEVPVKTKPKTKKGKKMANDVKYTPKEIKDLLAEEKKKWQAELQQDDADDRPASESDEENPGQKRWCLQFS